MSERVEDLYPSRLGGTPRILDRVDPVVYGKPGSNAPLSAEDTAFYERNGYLFIPEFFSSKDIAAYSAEMQALRRDRSLADKPWTITERGSGDIRSIFRVHDISPVFGQLCRDPRLVAIAEYLLDDQVYIHQSRVNYKPGFRGREFYWHSDFETWHVEDGMPRMRALSMSITLSENLETNGPLMIVPGSHKRFVSCVGRTPRDHYKSSLIKQEYGIPDDDSLMTLINDGGIDVPKGPPGSLLLFDCNVMHGSNSNITPFPRSNVFFVFNSLKNRVVRPFSGMPPRPEFIAARQSIAPIDARSLAA
ncbi:MAG: ectoine hydroxylase [Alphaproteobacteria bacterium]|nr:MAG: ectoine hydroxylase [Alphaproteobacteria bacterium]